MSLHLLTNLEDIFILTFILLSHCELFSHTFNMSHIYTVCAASSVHAHMQMYVCDTQPSITSLESCRSCCAPIHTHSRCFDFSKYKDVNHLPPLVRAGEFIHTGTHARLCTPPRPPSTQTHSHTQTIHQRPPPTSLHLSLALTRHSPSAIPLFESNFMCHVVHNTLLMDN